MSQDYLQTKFSCILTLLHEWTTSIGEIRIYRSESCSIHLVVATSKSHVIKKCDNEETAVDDARLLIGVADIQPTD